MKKRDTKSNKENTTNVLTGVLATQFSGRCLQHTSSVACCMMRQLPQMHQWGAAGWGSGGAVPGSSRWGSYSSIRSRMTPGFSVPIFFRKPLHWSSVRPSTSSWNKEQEDQRVVNDDVGCNTPIFSNLHIRITRYRPTFT